MTTHERLLAAWERIRDKRRPPESLDDALKDPALSRLVHMAAAYYDNPVFPPPDAKQRQAGDLDLFSE
jgi:hypothetical protein